MGASGGYRGNHPVMPGGPSAAIAVVLLLLLFVGGTIIGGRMLMKRRSARKEAAAAAAAAKTGDEEAASTESGSQETEVGESLPSNSAGEVSKGKGKPKAKTDFRRTWYGRQLPSKRAPDEGEEIEMA